MAIQIETINNVIHVAVSEGGATTRYTLAPGDNYSAHPPAVQAACIAAHTPEAIAAYQAQMAVYALPPAPPAPAHARAWADLITSPLYQRALGLAFAHLGVNTAMTTFGIAFQAHRDLPHEVWSGALSAAAGHLATAINATEAPLTQAEQQWVNDWNVAHHLGLSLTWEAP